jgi:hypothetical protein
MQDRSITTSIISAASSYICSSTCNVVVVFAAVAVSFVSFDFVVASIAVVVVVVSMVVVAVIAVVDFFVSVDSC